MTAFPALGTTAVVLCDAGDETIAVEAVQAEIAAIDTACSRFRDDSEITAVNASAGQPVRVSGLFLDALDVALRGAAITSGSVDPTVGSVMRALGYDRPFDSVERSGPAVVTIGPVPGWRAIQSDRSRGTVLVPAGVSLDFGATAKALCADRAAAAATRATGAGVLISLGGDIAVAGEPPAGGWPVRLADDHAAPPDEPGPGVRLSSGGLATSGTRVRRWERGGHVLHHIVDPDTGAPAATPWRTVTVAARCCVDANIASTAAVIMGEDAPAWLAARGLPGRLVREDGTVVTTGGWANPD